MSKELVYQKKLPTQVGWYWLLSPREEPQIVYIRSYAGNLALGNYSIVGWPKLEKSLWDDPIPEPETPIMYRTE